VWSDGVRGAVAEGQNGVDRRKSFVKQKQLPKAKPKEPI
jgi:hypothetical protein